MTSSSDVLTQIRLSRRQSVSAMFRSIVSQILHSITTQHLHDGRRQLVVFSFDHVAHRINLDGLYEREVLETFFNWVAKSNCSMLDGVAIDIGANIGNHSLHFAQFFKRVYSFEPNKRTFKVLALNAELVDNVQCFNVGLSDSNRQQLLHVDLQNVGGASIGNDDSGNSQIIELRTLDGVEELHSQNITLIKIDIEGHEYQALLGSRQVIEANRPIILFEQHPTDFRNGASKVMDLLAEYGYTKFATIERTPKSKTILSALLRYSVWPIYKILVGETVRFSVKSTIEPGFYSLIAALPSTENFPPQRT